MTKEEFENYDDGEVINHCDIDVDTNIENEELALIEEINCLSNLYSKYKKDGGNLVLINTAYQEACKKLNDFYKREDLKDLEN